MKVLITLTLILVGFSGLAQNSVVGKWVTIDDNTGEQRSIVELFDRGGKVYGKIIKIFPQPGKDPDPVCLQCPEDDNRYKKKIVGMEILQGMTKDGDAYAGGNILDPESGKIYRCKIWLENSNLMVRGYWGPFYRTQEWKRAN
ncbi:DUF2147 domain-containing protein [Pseudochryseolinea flava]|uniref:DUF2147 domain-containing protein n=1 Tax=Pseudochryseolinea flava TaxID=2059302 RepID=A0A364XVI5_9BACT|nr:DUF2147 domain-containing protein [Pseudochryseolinea flava]RAV98110.1 DUF2147 domain-containing protein [Pseudochryseolinea flava]